MSIGRSWTIYKKEMEDHKAYLSSFVQNKELETVLLKFILILENLLETSWLFESKCDIHGGYRAYIL